MEGASSGSLNVIQVMMWNFGDCDTMIHYLIGEKQSSYQSAVMDFLCDFEVFIKIRLVLCNYAVSVRLVCDGNVSEHGH
jgi:hypothetical protein